MSATPTAQASMRTQNTHEVWMTLEDINMTIWAATRTTYDASYSSTVAGIVK